MSITTRFRAFQLDTDGSLFSYYKESHYTLVEARLPKAGLRALQDDLASYCKETIDTLHITSWDVDHCSWNDLAAILNHLRPARIEVPGYVPDSDDARMCRDTLLKYDVIHQRHVLNVHEITPVYIGNLPTASAWENRDILTATDPTADCKNDRSLIRLFRSAGFSVLSLGDCESAEIAARLMRDPIMRTEVDVIVLPHHGADNGFISDEFLKALKPIIAVSTSNWGNAYGHPKPEVRQMLANNNVELMTSKAGDVFIIQEAGGSTALAVDLDQNGHHVQKQKEFMPKRVLHALVQPAQFANG